MLILQQVYSSSKDSVISITDKNGEKLSFNCDLQVSIPMDILDLVSTNENGNVQVIIENEKVLKIK